MQDHRMAEAVMKLHEIAHMIEAEIGSGKLSEDVRSCADRLHKLTQPFKLTAEQ